MSKKCKTKPSVDLMKCILADNEHHDCICSSLKLKPLNSFHCRSTWLYHIAGKIGGELNLAIWRFTCATAKLKYAIIAYICMAIPY